MSAADIHSILESNERIETPAQIQQVVDAAIARKAFLDIQLNQQDEHFASQLLAPGDEGATEEGHKLLVSPLEPGLGNFRIRKSRQVTLKFQLDHFYLLAKVRFKNVARLKGGNQGIGLSYPGILNVQTQRTKKRYLPPESSTCALRARRKDGATVNGVLLDIHSDGLGFLSPEPDLLFNMDDLVKVQMITGIDDFETLHMNVAICFMRKHRDMAETGKAITRYGTKIIHLESAMAFSKYMDLCKGVKRLGAR